LLRPAAARWLRPPAVQEVLDEIFRILRDRIFRSGGTSDRLLRASAAAGWNDRDLGDGGRVTMM